MLKRKFADRTEWKRILKRKYAQKYMNTSDFTGYITLLHTIKVAEPLWINYGYKKVSIADVGYMWLQQFPLNKNHSVTSVFDVSGDIVQWYIDITYKNSVENNVPYMDDLFLDIVLLPLGELIEKDADELEEAFSKGMIDRSLYDLAWSEHRKIKSLILKEQFDLITFSEGHKNLLKESLK